MIAFLRRKEWSQAALARHCEVDSKTLKRQLRELRDGGLPLTERKSHPHVYWRVDAHWFPGGTLVRDEDRQNIARLLRRLEDSHERRRALSALDIGGGGGTERKPLSSLDREKILAQVENAALESKVIHMRYFTASRGEVGIRDASVHRVVLDRAIRFVATCHRTGKLRMFRVDNVEAVAFQETEPFRPADERDVSEFLATTVDGYRGDGTAIDVRFWVRKPEADWARTNLPSGPFSIELFRDGIRVETKTAALEVVARFVVGLGEGASAETPELKRRVAALARGAERNTRSGRPIQPTK